MGTFQRVTEDGKEMSVAPSYCRAGQTPYDFPQENGENIGQKLTTTALCMLQSLFFFQGTG